MLVNELVSSCNLEALLMVDPDLFSNMVVPDGVEKSGVIAAIRRKHGLAPLYHPDPYWMKTELYWWSRENLPIWKKLFATTQLDYNPIWNSDMSEKTRDTTETTRDTSQQNTANSNGGSHDQTQHADDRHATETTGNFYHEHTKADGFTTDNSAGQEKTVTDTDGKEHGFAHTQTEGTEHRDTKGTLDTAQKGTVDTATTGTRFTTHDETMIDKLTGEKTSTTDVEGKISSENEAGYQPFDAQTTKYSEKTSSDETRKTDWTENENTSGTVDTDTTDTIDTDTTETMDSRTTSTSDTETKQDSTSISKGQSDRIDRAHGTHGDTGSTDGHGHTERQNGERGTAQDTAINAHHENALSTSTGKVTETVVMTHEYTKGGNIGVTTTQQMIEAERESVLFNIYGVVADSFHRTFCLDVY